MISPIRSREFPSRHKVHEYMWLTFSGHEPNANHGCQYTSLMQYRYVENQINYFLSWTYHTSWLLLYFTSSTIPQIFQIRESRFPKPQPFNQVDTFIGSFPSAKEKEKQIETHINELLYINEEMVTKQFPTYKYHKYYTCVNSHRNYTGVNSLNKVSCYISRCK